MTVTSAAPTNAGSTTELRDRVRDAASGRRSLRIAGGASWLDANRPVRAEATIDARNLFDVLTRAEEGDGGQLTLGALRRSLRGGISVRF